jgi:cytochrome b6-f complex iron-sulfur subunit
MDRRGFCLNACQLAALVGLGSVVDGCGGSPTSPSGSVPALPTIAAAFASGTVMVNVAADSPLAAVGGAALVESGAGKFLVVRAAQDAFNAMTAICTHEQCTITGFANQTFTCPCHGSKFSTTGAVVNGPASRPLSRFSTAFTAATLTIAV